MKPYIIFECMYVCQAMMFYEIVKKSNVRHREEKKKTSSGVIYKGFNNENFHISVSSGLCGLTDSNLAK